MLPLYWNVTGALSVRGPGLVTSRVLTWKLNVAWPVESGVTRRLLPGRTPPGEVACTVPATLPEGSVRFIVCGIRNVTPGKTPGMVAVNTVPLPATPMLGSRPADGGSVNPLSVLYPAPTTGCVPVLADRKE